MKTIHLHLLSIAMLLVTALPSMAQSARLDSLQRVNADILQQSEALQLQFDSLYRIIAIVPRLGTAIRILHHFL